MHCPWFDDCDISTLGDAKREQYTKLREWRDAMLDAVDKSIASDGEQKTRLELPSYQVLRMISEAYQVIGDMRSRYERAFGVNIQSTDVDKKAWFHVIVEDLDVKKHSIAHMSQDINTLKELDQCHMHFFCNRNVFLGMRDVGMMDCLIPHESVHIWECVHTWFTGGADAVMKKNEDHKRQALEYDRLHQEYQEMIAKDHHKYHHPVWGTELYPSMIERKRLYSDTIDWERHVTEFHMADSGLTYDEALEMAHSSFFDFILGLLWEEDIASDASMYEDIIEAVEEELEQTAPAVRPIFNRWYQNLLNPSVALRIAHMKHSLAASQHQILDDSGTLADKLSDKMESTA